MDMYDCTVGTLHVQNVTIYAVRHTYVVDGWVCMGLGMYVHRWLCVCVHLSVCVSPASLQPEGSVQ